MIEVTDRYQALGIPYPDPQTMCKGQCEGTGWFPECDESSPLWQEAHRAGCSTFWARLKRMVKLREWRMRRCDGWHFVKCPDCNGTGKRL